MHKYKEKILHKTFEIAKHQPRIYNVRIAASLVYRNKIVFTCSNIRKTHTFQHNNAKNDEAIFLHAENNCILTALKAGFTKDEMTKCDIYIARAKFINGNWSLGNVCPCKGCQKSIKYYKLRNVFYTTDTEVRRLTFSS